MSRFFEKHQRRSFHALGTSCRGAVLRLVSITLFGAILLAASAARAQDAVYVPLQGGLADDNNNPIDGTTTMHFALYASQSASTALWEEDQTIDVDQGAFVVYLGEVETLSASVFRDYADLWLGITVENDPEMDRVFLGSTPYSAFADYCGHADNADDAQTLEGHSAADFRQAADAVSWDDLSEIPAEISDGDADTLGGMSCASGQVAKWNGTGWACADDVDSNTIYTGADFALSDQSCNAGDVVTGVNASGGVVCAPDYDTDTTYDGGDFALSSQDCGDGQVARGVNPDGTLMCVADMDTQNTYSGADFAVSFQQCPTGEYLTGIDANGQIVCERPPVRKHAGAIYRWNTFHTYHNGSSWLLNNEPSHFGGVTPDAWTDGNALADAISPDKEVLRTLFTRKGYGGANANIVSNVFHQYSSTNGQVTVALFRIRNTTGSDITWTPYFAYTCFYWWGERASVALNGTLMWQSGSENCTNNSRTNVDLTIPANRISTVIFVSPSSDTMSPGSGIQVRANILVFYNNSLALPNGLEYVDDLDIATGGWDQ
jgi:hypothetical protein